MLVKCVWLLLCYHLLLGGAVEFTPTVSPAKLVSSSQCVSVTPSMIASSKAKSSILYFVEAHCYVYDLQSSLASFIAKLIQLNFSAMWAFFSNTETYTYTSTCILTMMCYNRNKEILKLRVWSYISVVQALLMAIPQSRLQTSGVFLVQMASNILHTVVRPPISLLPPSLVCVPCPMHVLQYHSFYRCSCLHIYALLFSSVVIFSFLRCSWFRNPDMELLKAKPMFAIQQLESIFTKRFLELMFR